MQRSRRIWEQIYCPQYRQSTNPPDGLRNLGAFPPVSASSEKLVSSSAQILNLFCPGKVVLVNYGRIKIYRPSLHPIRRSMESPLSHNVNKHLSR